MNPIHLRLKEIRRARNLSQEKLAQQLGVSRQAVIALEQGASLPSLPVLLALMRVLDLPFPRLFNETWKPFRSPENETDTDRSDLSFYQNHTKESIPINLVETGDRLMLTAELSGVKEQDIAIDLSQQHVLIMAARKHHNEGGHDRIHATEIAFGPLARIIGLPSPIDTDQAKAQFDDGLLVLTLPKFLPAAQRRITFTTKEAK